MKITLQSHNIISAARHIQLLGELFGCEDIHPCFVFETLLKAEREANRKSLDFCNGKIDEDAYEQWQEKFLKRLTKNLGVSKMPDGFFLNGDPRGYSLKMKEKTFPQGLWTDFGGYGILAPDFS